MEFKNIPQGIAGSLPGLGDFLKWFIKRYDRLSGCDPNAIRKDLKVIMGKLDNVGQQIDQNTAKADKAFAEIRKALDEALASQITQEELDAAVQAAKDAQKNEDDTALDAELQTLSEKIASQNASLQKLDDIVPDPSEPEPSPEPSSSR